MIRHFKNLIDPHLLTLLVVLLVCCAIATMLFAAVTPGFAKQRKSKFFPYVILLALIYILILLGENSGVFSELSQVFLYCGLVALVLGIFHLLAYRHYFSAFEETSFLKESFFAIVVALYGTVPFVIGYTFLNGTYFTITMSTHVVSFIIPTVFYCTFERAIAIPSPQYATWDFPASQNVPEEFVGDKYHDMMVITFFLSRSAHSQETIVLFAKTRADAVLQNTFHRLVVDYNNISGNESIETGDLDNSYGWTFFLHRGWYRKLKYIDPRKTFVEAGIADNNRISCYRLKRNLAEEHMAERKAKEFKM